MCQTGRMTPDQRLAKAQDALTAVLAELPALPEHDAIMRLWEVSRASEKVLRPVVQDLTTP